jgi:chemotaxis protein methyltransferase CheR
MRWCGAPAIDRPRPGATMSVPAAPAPADGLSQADFERVRALIHRHAGIALGPGKKAMVHSRLSRRLRALGRADFGGYLDDLERGGSAQPEWQAFVNALTTNLTAFFREAHHFPLLAQHLRRRAAQGPLQLWCCAASSGEEPYSIAMTVLDAFEPQARPQASILATDIDTAVLERAREGVYPIDAVARLDPSLLRRHFLRGSGARQGLVRVRPELASMISFRPLNLLAPRWPMPTRFDAIFCRNVMIYFDPSTQRRVLQRLAQSLKPDGLLFAGHAENLGHASELFERQGRTVYRLARPAA